MTFYLHRSESGHLTVIHEMLREAREQDAINALWWMADVPSLMHAKFIVADGVTGYFGTANRLRHFRAVPNATSSFAPIAVLPRPSAAANTIRDRIANAFALFARRDQATSWARSSSDNTTARATGLVVCRQNR